MNKLNSVIVLILQAEAYEKKLIEKFNDDKNIIFKVYSRNQVIRSRYSTIMGNSTGDCEAESYKQIIPLIDLGYKPRLLRAEIYLEELNRCIYHQFLVITIENKLYYESRANGIHKRLPLEVWYKNNIIRNLIEVPIRISSAK